MGTKNDFTLPISILETAKTSAGDNPHTVPCFVPFG